MDKCKECEKPTANLTNGLCRRCHAAAQYWTSLAQAQVTSVYRESWGRPSEMAATAPHAPMELNDKNDPSMMLRNLREMGADDDVITIFGTMDARYASQLLIFIADFGQRLVQHDRRERATQALEGKNREP